MKPKMLHQGDSKLSHRTAAMVESYAEALRMGVTTLTNLVPVGLVYKRLNEKCKYGVPLTSCRALCGYTGLIPRQKDYDIKRLYTFYVLTVYFVRNDPLEIPRMLL